MQATLKHPINADQDQEHPRRSRLLGAFKVGHAFWPSLMIIQCLALAGILVWTYYDPAFSILAEQQSHQWGLVHEHWNPFQATTPDRLGARSSTLQWVLVIAGLSWFAMAANVAYGSAKRRTIAHWLIMLTLAAAWMATATGWPKLSRLGKRHRVVAAIQEFEGLAQELKTAWPKYDGSTDKLGPYMAYPISHPSMLILLTLPELKSIDASISVVERGSAGQLRFQLAGMEQGDWIEWHPKNSQPASFVGGISDVFELLRADRLNDNWYMVRYRSMQSKLHEA